MHRDDRGFTLVEMLVVMSLLLVALGLFSGALWNVQRASARQDQIGRASDAAYQALSEIDRQLRSGYIASETRFSGADATLVDMVRIYTEAYAPPSSAASPNTVARCVAWAIVAQTNGTQGLYTVWWTPKPGVAAPTYVPATRSFSISAITGITNVSGSRLVASDLIGSDLSSFTVQGLVGGLSQRLLVTLRLQEASDGTLSSPAPGSPSPWVNTISTTITPRNSPRASMNADTAAYGASPSPGSVLRSVLCG